MRTPILAITATLATVLTAGCDIDQIREGEMPDVEVTVEEGQLPEYDVDVADVEVGVDEDTIIVSHPTVDVEMPEDEPSEEDEDGTGNER